MGEAGLVKTILFYANLFSANLSWATLTGADLTGANLSRVNSSSAVLIGATIGYFEYAVLIDVNFKGAIGMLINGHFNLIWDTTMFDGIVEKSPYCKWK